jgi:hypothetical protein
MDAAIRIGFDLRNQYLIEYHSVNQNWNGLYGRSEVEHYRRTELQQINAQRGDDPANSLIERYDKRLAKHCG